MVVVVVVRKVIIVSVHVHYFSFFSLCQSGYKIRLLQALKSLVVVVVGGWWWLGK